MKSKSLLSFLIFLFLFIISSSVSSAQAATYYVDSTVGNDSNSCTSAQSTQTPKKSVNSVQTCNPGAGDIVKFRGTFSQTIRPTQSGQILYPFQPITQVSASHVQFNQNLTNLNPQTDIVAVYNSRKGNSGAFPIVSVSTNTVTVDTTALPSGQFLLETASDPGDLHAAILRPVHYTAWEKTNPPVWTGNIYTLDSYNQHTIMLSYIHSKTGDTGQVWPAFQLRGDPDNSSDYHIFDHLEVEFAETAINTQNGTYHADYAIIQHSNFHQTGMEGGASDEVIYWGNYEGLDKHFDYVQIMYNKIGPHRSQINTAGDGIELKLNARYGTLFGNEIFGIVPNGCDDAPIKVSAAQAYIANNFIHDITPPDPRDGCGISVVGGGQGDGTIVVNNILKNIKDVAIRNLKTSDMIIANNTIYNVFPKAGSSQAHGILIWDYSVPITNLIVQNNIIHTAPTGIGRYSGAGISNYQVNHNIIYNTTTPLSFFSLSSSDSTQNPNLTNPNSNNFTISADSIAIDTGINLSQIFSLDNHDAADPTWSSGITPPAIRSGNWDIGAYEYTSDQPTPPPTGGSTPSPAPTPIPGDANDDRKVDGVDYMIWLNHYNTQTTSGRSVGDFNSDQKVDGIDYIIWLNNYS